MHYTIKARFELIHKGGGVRMEWKKFFSNRILSRGYEYYEDGMVMDFAVQGNIITATVCGTHDYDVVIDTYDPQNYEVYCDCPYATNHDLCKHMAAVLYHYDDHHNAQGGHQNSTQHDHTLNIKKTLDHATHDELSAFLEEIFKTNEGLYNQFKRFVRAEVSSEDVLRYKKDIKRIFTTYSRNHGFIDYNNAFSFITDLRNFLHEQVEVLIQQGHTMEAFELSTYLYIMLANQDFDDSNGGFGDIESMCTSMWLEIHNQSSLEDKRILFQWFMEYSHGKMIDYAEESIEAFLFDNFHEGEFIQPKLNYVQKQLDSLEGNNSWLEYYNNGKYRLRHIQLMSANNESPEVMRQYCLEYINVPTIRIYYVQECMKDEAYEEAIRVLKEGKIVDQDRNGQLKQYSELLRHIYKHLKLEAEYEAELYQCLIDYTPGDLKLYKELKSLYTPEEWDIKREIIFESLGKSDALDDFYKEDKLYDRLLARVQDSNISKLLIYEDVLKPLYPKECLEMFERELMILSVHATNRRYYQELVGLLRRMLTYPNGPHRVNMIVGDWQVRYKNRPAMMDELSKL